MLTRLSAGGLLLASLFLSACSDDPQSTDADTAPAYDQAQGKRVVSHYADVALATFGDALSGARALKTQIDALLAAPTRPTWPPPVMPGVPRGCPTCRQKYSASAMPRWMNGKGR